jgi:hypothetical protein
MDRSFRADPWWRIAWLALLSTRTHPLGNAVPDSHPELRTVKFTATLDTIRSAVGITKRAVALVIVAMLLGACSTPSHGSPNVPMSSASSTKTFTEPTESPNPSNNEVCALIDNDYLYEPTIPAHVSISLHAAMRIEGLLRRGAGLWLREARPLQTAISTNNESGILRIFGYLQFHVCGTAGFTPAT